MHTEVTLETGDSVTTPEETLETGAIVEHQLTLY